MANPLDGYNYTMGDTSGMYQYYMQVRVGRCGLASARYSISDGPFVCR